MHSYLWEKLASDWWEFVQKKPTVFSVLLHCTYASMISESCPSIYISINLDDYIPAKAMSHENWIFMNCIEIVRLMGFYKTKAYDWRSYSWRLQLEYIIKWLLSSITTIGARMFWTFHEHKILSVLWVDFLKISSVLQIVMRKMLVLGKGISYMCY